MARKDLPYLKLYTQDFMTDERLMECSASATGVYIKFMCVLHKSDDYGKFLLKQKDKQNIEQIYEQLYEQSYKQIGKQVFYFACKLAKHLPFNFTIILEGINELINEGCLKIDGDMLYQKRMVDDNNLSVKRSESGGKGGKKTQKANKKFALANSNNFALAKSKANTDPEYEYNNTGVKGGAGGKNEKGKMWFLRFYKSDYENYKSVFNGQSATEEVFQKWKKFIDLIYEKNYKEIFAAKFVNPKDFGVLEKNGFVQDKWDEILQRILATGVKPEHNLFFRIPQFLGYSANGKNGKPAAPPPEKKIILK